jgi:hypothetical protein
MLGYRYLFASRVITINASSLSLFFSKADESCQPFEEAVILSFDIYLSA